MNLAPGQLSTLTEMGIPVWELRQPSSTAQIIGPLSTEIIEPLPSVDCLIVVSEQDNNDIARRLLHAMLLAIGLTQDNSAIVSPQQLSHLTTTSATNHKLILAFGDNVVPEHLTSSVITHGQSVQATQSTLKIISSLSLTTLLTSPEKKAHAWQDLQMAKSSYQQTLTSS